jgi:hypothetical protein
MGLFSAAACLYDASNGSMSLGHRAAGGARMSVQQVETAVTVSLVHLVGDDRLVVAVHAMPPGAERVLATRLREECAGRQAR